MTVPAFQVRGFALHGAGPIVGERAVFGLRVLHFNGHLHHVARPGLSSLAGTRLTKASACRALAWLFREAPIRNQPEAGEMALASLPGPRRPAIPSTSCRRRAR